LSGATVSPDQPAVISPVLPITFPPVGVGSPVESMTHWSTGATGRCLGIRLSGSWTRFPDCLSDHARDFALRVVLSFHPLRKFTDAVAALLLAPLNQSAAVPPIRRGKMAAPGRPKSADRTHLFAQILCHR
jgi:hypothetical protein